MERTSKKFYGWIIVLCSFLISMFAMGIVSSTISFYMKPVCDELGCSYVQFSAINIVSSLAGMVSAIWLAPKIEKGSIKKVMILSALATGLGFALMGFGTQIWHLYVLFGIANLGIGGLTSLPINYMLSNWFVDKKGLATSIAFSGSGIGGIFWSPLISSMIGGIGWRKTFLFSGLLVTVISVLVCLLVKKNPAEAGQEPYRLADKGEKRETAAARAPAWEGVTKSQAIASPTFWVFALALVCMGMIAAGVMTQVPTYYSERGISYAAIMSLYSLAAIIGKLIGGVIFDKIGLTGGIAFTSICNVLALLGLIFSVNIHPLSYLFSIAIGFGMVISMLGPPLITSGLFGTKEYAKIYSFSNAFFLGGCMIGPILSSGLRTMSGSYNTAWYAYIVIAIAYFLLSLLALRLSKSFRTEKNK